MVVMEPAAAAAEELRQFGFVVLPSLLPLDYVSRLRDRGEALLAAEHGATALQGPGAELTSGDTLCQGEDRELFLPVLRDPTIHALASSLMGGDAGSGYQSLGSLSLKWRRGPSAGGPVHADVPLGAFPQQGLPTPREVCFGLNCYVFLSEWTAASGAT